MPLIYVSAARMVVKCDDETDARIQAAACYVPTAKSVHHPNPNPSKPHITTAAGVRRRDLDRYDEDSPLRVPAWRAWLRGL